MPTMELLPWIDLTAKQGTFSGGQLPDDCTTQWNLNWSDPSTSATYQFELGIQPDGDARYALNITGAGLNHEMLARLLGCAIIANLPPSGLPEALSSLGTIWAFHRETLPEPQLLPPARVRARSALAGNAPELVIG